jgi:hypothetical protein
LRKRLFFERLGQPGAPAKVDVIGGSGAGGGVPALAKFAQSVMYQMSSNG